MWYLTQHGGGSSLVQEGAETPRCFVRKVFHWSLLHVLGASPSLETWSLLQEGSHQGGETEDWSGDAS